MGHLGRAWVLVIFLVYTCMCTAGEVVRWGGRVRFPRVEGMEYAVVYSDDGITRFTVVEGMGASWAGGRSTRTIWGGSCDTAECSFFNLLPQGNYTLSVYGKGGEWVLSRRFEGGECRLVNVQGAACLPVQSTVPHSDVVRVGTAWFSYPAAGVVAMFAFVILLLRVTPHKSGDPRFLRYVPAIGFLITISIGVYLCAIPLDNGIPRQDAGVHRSLLADGPLLRAQRTALGSPSYDAGTTESILSLVLAQNTTMAKSAGVVSGILSREQRDLDDIAHLASQMSLQDLAGPAPQGDYQEVPSDGLVTHGEVLTREGLADAIAATIEKVSEAVARLASMGLAAGIAAPQVAPVVSMLSAGAGPQLTPTIDLADLCTFPGCVLPGPSTPRRRCGVEPRTCNPSRDIMISVRLGEAYGPQAMCIVGPWTIIDLRDAFCGLGALHVLDTCHGSPEGCFHVPDGNDIALEVVGCGEPFDATRTRISRTHAGLSWLRHDPSTYPFFNCTRGGE